MNIADKEFVHRTVLAAEDTNSLIATAKEAKERLAVESALLGQLEFIISQRMNDGLLYFENDGKDKAEREPKWTWDKKRLEELGYIDYYSPKKPKAEWKFETRKLNTLAQKLKSEAAEELRSARTATWRMEYGS